MQFDIQQFTDATRQSRTAKDVQHAAHTLAVFIIRQFVGALFHPAVVEGAELLQLRPEFEFTDAGTDFHRGIRDAIEE